jgi:hypothetical protein
MLPKAQNLPKTSTSPSPPKNNRRFVIICLGLTIFLSLSFLIYRKVAPILNGSKPVVIDFPSPSTQDFNNIPSSWSIYIGQYTNNQITPLYSKNFNSDVNQIISQLKTLPPNSNSLISSSLPEGVSISEFDSDPKIINFQYLITLPKFQLVMVINNQDRSSQNLKFIPQIVSTLYWGLVGSR